MYCEAADISKEVQTVFVTPAKPSIESSIRDYFTLYLVWAIQERFWPDSLVSPQNANNVWCSMVFFFSGCKSSLGSHKDLFLPLLFLIYIKDIAKRIGSSIQLFTSYFIIVELPEQAARVLNANRHILIGQTIGGMVFLIQTRKFREFMSPITYNVRLRINELWWNK